MLTTTDESGNFFTNLERSGDSLADLFDNSSIIAAHNGARGGAAIQAPPICGIQGDGFGLDDDVVVSKLRLRNLAHFDGSL